MEKNLLTFDQIKELIDKVAQNHLGGLELELSDFRLKVDGYAPPATTTVVHSAPAAPAPALVAPVAHQTEAPASSTPPPPVAQAKPENIKIIKSPFVGIFYRAPKPSDPPFVEVGTPISLGQVLCIVEAMKLMNEIEAELAGTITRVIPQNGQAVEFGEPLFEVKI